MAIAGTVLEHLKTAARFVGHLAVSWLDADESSRVVAETITLGD